MKNLILVLFVLSGHAYAETCLDKIKSIETKIEFAREHNNKAELQGLESALAETRLNCTDEKLKISKNKKIQEKENDIEEALKELNEAKNNKKSDGKIKKKQDKLQEKIKELESLKK